MNSRGLRDLSGRPLTPRQQRFVEEYLCDLNATQAYLRAGYAVSNANVAKVNASRMLTNANIQAAIQEARQRLSQRTEISQDTVVQGLYKEATLTGEGSTHGARVSAWGHLADHFLPKRTENKNLNLNADAQALLESINALPVEQLRALRAWLEGQKGGE